MKIPNNYLAAVVLSEEDKNRARELYGKYSKWFELSSVFVDLLDDKIGKEDLLSAREIRILLREAFLNENSANLRNVFLCIAKGLYFCTEEELKIAHITM